MPPAYVKTIREEILYEYAKIISRSAYGALQRAFITERFKKLRDGEVTISGTMREWEREASIGVNKHRGQTSIGVRSFFLHFNLFINSIP